MLYRELAELYDGLESTASRLDMTTMLASFLTSVDCEDLPRIVYLTQGKTHPDFYPQKLGLADRLLIKAVAFTSGIPEGEVSRMWLEEGDPGLAAERAIGRKTQTALFHEDLTLERVYGNLERIESMAGSRSQEGKIKLLADLLHDATPLESKYLVRTVAGRMRLGVANMTVVDALSQAFADRTDKPVVERAYNVTSDLGLVARTLCEGGIDAVGSLEVRVGNPIRAMLAERLPSVEGILTRMGGTCAFEYKYDGLRVQAHKRGDELRLFSRRLEDLTPQFPEVADALREAISCEEAIVEGECVPVDLSTGEMLPFQEVSHRRGRKHGLDAAMEEYPVRILLFDCLYMDGDLTQRPFPDRRRALESHVALGDRVGLSSMEVIDDPERAGEFFMEALDAGCEGLMAKSLGEDSVYRAGARGFLWIKYKKDYRSEMSDTVDLVVVGAFAGRGRRSGRYGALLMATYDPDASTYETVCKLGSGFDDQDLEALPGMLDERLLGSPHTSVDTRMQADFWFEPSLVLEVLGAEVTISPVHTCCRKRLDGGSGLAIRFPRYTGRVRDDKGPEDATTSDEVLSMYGDQSKHVASMDKRL